MSPHEILARFSAVRDALDELERRDAVSLLHARDAGLWSDDEGTQAAIADRLGWLDVAGGAPDWPLRLTAFRERFAEDGFDRIVLAGMGGSSLAAEVFARLFADKAGRADFVLLDSTHPSAVRAALEEPDLSSTLVIVASKSGTTEETRAFAARAEALVDSPSQLVAVTDPGSELAEHARSAGWREVFLNPPDIGGRYSALSLFGMVPAALLKIDIRQIWERAAAMLLLCGDQRSVRENPAAILGAFMGGLAREGRDKLTVLAPPALEPLGDWIEQLVAESTGKDGKGVVPVVREPMGDPHVYGDDRAFVELRLGGEPVAGAPALADAGHPVLTIDVDSRAELGAEFTRWEIATALAAVVLGVNPFDEPNVSESKRNTRTVLDEVASGGNLPDVEDGNVADLLEGLSTGDYLSIQSYLAPSQQIAAGLEELRVMVRDATRVATTVGWGPRFLHSTGQLHKGGPESVAVLQLVDTPEPDLLIPGRDYDFATLLRAQAAGDLHSLREHGRRVVQIGIDGPPALFRVIADARAALEDRSAAD